MSVEKTILGTLSVFELGSATVTAELRQDQTKELHCFQVSQTEIEQVQDLMEQTGIYELDAVLQRLHNGQLGFVGGLENPAYPDKLPLLVTYGWVAFMATSIGTTGLDFVPPPGDAYLFDFATMPAYRGRGYYPLLLRSILLALTQKGTRRAWIATAPGNTKSARSIARAGFQKVADCLYVPANKNQPPQMKLFPVPGVEPALLALGQMAHVPNGTEPPFGT